MAVVPSKDNKDDFRKMGGPQKAAMFLMAIGEESAIKLFALMDDDEIREISNIMSGLGQVNSDVVERLFHDFADQVSASGALVGNYDSTERLLVKALGKNRVDGIMEEIRGPAGRTTWDKLGNVSEEKWTTSTSSTSLPRPLSPISIPASGSWQGMSVS